MKMVMAIVAAALALGAHGAERSITREVVVKAPVEAVWKSWTTSEGIQSFFAPEAHVEARPEGAFHVHFNPYAPPGAKGADDMRVLAVQEKKLISFTWNAPPPPARRPSTTHLRDGAARTRFAHRDPREPQPQRLGRGLAMGAGLRLLQPRLGHRPR